MAVMVAARTCICPLVVNVHCLEVKGWTGRNIMTYVSSKRVSKIDYLHAVKGVVGPLNEACISMLSKRTIGDQ